MSFKLTRAADPLTAATAYSDALLKHFQADETLINVPEATKRLFATQIAKQSAPKIIRIAEETTETGSKIYICIIQPGLWAPELSGILGADLNLHCGPGATLASAGLIGLYTPAVSHTVGGQLIKIDPVQFTNSITAQDQVEINLVFTGAKLTLCFFNTTSKILTGDNAGKPLCKPAELVVSGADMS